MAVLVLDPRTAMTGLESRSFRRLVLHDRDIRAMRQDSAVAAEQSSNRRAPCLLDWKIRAVIVPRRVV